ncbi:SMP-30/gluconolactonase/LRE family protein [Nevskia ramosa]|uniref:SMP-30/gluconolactonase/LRE family protein n=1 Tax=Nevskia ramosa TaxID=64002 RepID=UPI003D108813
MNRLTQLLSSAALSLWALPVFAVGPEPVWTLSGFAQPESVVYAKQQDLFYVSNINGEGTAKDGNGFISRVSPDGKMIKREWLKGLNAPKGLAYNNGFLYIADIDELVVVDTGNSRITARYKAAGAKFLNDVAVDSGGRVYVSDTGTNSIWRLSGTSFAVMLSSPKLEGPNGLLVEGGKLIVGSWGVMTGNGFETSEMGYLQSVDRTTAALEPRFAPIPFANIDGLVSDGKGGYILSDWMHGNVYKITATGEANLWLLLEQGSADIGLGPNKRLLVPMMLNNELRAYALD